MTDAARYVVPPGFQLRDGGTTGPVDCTAWAASRLIGKVTAGAKQPSGRAIRLRSDEPVPDRASPGLNIPQVAEVALEDHGVYFEQRIGTRALTFEEYDERRKGGSGMVIQLSYKPIALSRFNAGRGFMGGHAIFEDQHTTIDSLADGRAPGVYRYAGPLVYPRSLIREAAGDLIIAQDPTEGPIRVGNGKVWCAVGMDTAPLYEVHIHPRKGHNRRRFRSFDITNGRITDWDERKTGGFTAPCTAPRAYRWADIPSAPDHELRYLVKITAGARRGLWVRAFWAREMGA